MGRHARDPARAVASDRLAPPSRGWLVRAAALVAVAAVAASMWWSVATVTVRGGPTATALGAVSPAPTATVTSASSGEPSESGESGESGAPGESGESGGSGQTSGPSVPGRVVVGSAGAASPGMDVSGAGPPVDRAGSVDQPDAWADALRIPSPVPGLVESSSPPGSTSWRAVLAHLDAQRGAAFGAGDDALLAQVYAPASAPLARDRVVLEELTAAGQRAVGLRLTVDEVTVVEAGVDAVTLRVVDRMAAYRIVDGADRTLATVPGRGATAWLLTLTPGPNGWLISAIGRG